MARAGHLRAVYENGRLARVEKDTEGNGRINLWVYYDYGKRCESSARRTRP